MTDKEIEGTWKWYGTDRKVFFTDWDSGQPDNFNGREDCAILWNGPFSYKWNDGLCAEPYAVICEKNS